MVSVVGDDGSPAARSALALARRMAVGDERVVRVRVPAGVGVAGGLVEAAEREGAALIAVGASARRHHLLPSVAERLVRVAATAVLVVPEGFDRPISLIGVAYDGRPEARRALRQAEALARRFDASVVVMRATKPDKLLSVAGALDRTAGWLRAGGVRASARPVVGPPERSLPSASAGVDLVVAGSRGRGAVTAAMLGSTSRALVEDVWSTPVLLTPRASLAHPLSTVPA